MKNKLLLFFFVLTPLSLVAEEVGHSFVYKDLQYTVIGEDSVSVTGTANGGFYGEAYIMPDCVYDMDKAYTVVSIGDGWGTIMDYKGCLMGGSHISGIYADTLYLPKTLKKIGYCGLAGMSCRRIIIPDGVEEIGNYAIYYCLNLDSIWLPASLSKVSDNLFDGNGSLKYVSVPDGITEIGLSAFSGCKSLESIKIPDCVKEIGRGAFANCTSLKSINLPDGMTRIDSYLLQYCKSLTDLDIPASITAIGDCAFRGTGLGSIVIPNSVTSIGDSAFAACRYLRSVRLPSALTAIPHGAFRGTLVTSVTIPETVEWIGAKAFGDCNFLNAITVNSQTPPRALKSSFSNYNATVYVPSGCRSTYEPADTWSLFANIVEKEEESGSFYLTVVQPSGAVGFKVQEGSRQELLFVPDDGCRIHSVSYNGTDITSLLEADGSFITPAIHADARVEVVFEQGTLAIATAKAGNPQVRVIGQTVYVSGCESAAPIRMYSADGRLLCSVQADEQGTARLSATESVPVIVSVADRQFKLFLHP